MNTVLIVIILIMTPNGVITKQTTEVEMDNIGACKSAQLHIMYEPTLPNVKLMSVTCSTTGEI